MPQPKARAHIRPHGREADHGSRQGWAHLLDIEALVVAQLGQEQRNQTALRTSRTGGGARARPD
eukprot:10430500-Lingulodinium_polyedra.AAC.1